MTKSINHTFFFTHPPRVVWEYLTNAELMAQWLMPNDFLPLVGYDFQFKVNPVPALEFDGIVYCKVLEVKPFTKLSYSWKCGPGNMQITVDSLVEWTLQEKENGTELRLNHSGFKEGIHVPLYTAMHDGWAKNIAKINNLLNTATHGTANA